MGAARTRTQLRRLAGIMVVVGAITPVFNVLTGEASVQALSRRRRRATTTPALGHHDGSCDVNEASEAIGH